MTRFGARTIAYAVVASLAALIVAAAPPGAGTQDTPARRATGSTAGDTNRAVLFSAPSSVPQLAAVEVDAQIGTDTVAVAGRIASNLYNALDSSAADAIPQHSRWKLAWSMADIFEYRIDMSRDLRVGDAFRVLVERVMDSTGGVRLGRVLATSFVQSRDTLTAIRFAIGAPTSAANVDPVAGEYFDVRGRSLRAAFLRAPVEFRRISSGFGMRMHPILRVWREHKGTDYVAAAGTPVRAIGDGVVLFAGQKGGYGNVIDLRHRNGYVTRYGHLSRFAAGIRRGTRVTIGKTIAFVGMTGLATAPHLHFEVLVDGVQHDPRVALRDRGSGDPVPMGQRDTFDRTARTLMARLNGAPGISTQRLVASRQ